MKDKKVNVQSVDILGAKISILKKHFPECIASAGPQKMCIFYQPSQAYYQESWIVFQHLVYFLKNTPELSLICIFFYNIWDFSGNFFMFYRMGWIGKLKPSKFTIDKIFKETLRIYSKCHFY